MPTVLRVGGFAVRIYGNDHEPAHVHVYGADGWCKVDIGTAAVTKVVGMKNPEVRRAASLTVAHRHLLTREWEEIHG